MGNNFSLINREHKSCLDGYFILGGLSPLVYYDEEVMRVEINLCVHGMCVCACADEHSEG